MNKKLTLIIWVLIGSFTAKAQTQKGSQLLGGSISFGISNGSQDYVNYQNSTYNYSGTSKTRSFSIGPIYSVFIADQLDLGVSAGYSTQKSTYNYSVFNSATTGLINESNSKAVYGSIYLRKYFLYKQKAGIRTGPFAQYQYSKYQYNYLYLQSINNNYQKGNNANAGLILDLVYFPTRRIGITSTLGTLAYSYADVKNDSQISSDHNKSNSFGLGFSSALNLSVVYCFGK